MRISTFRAKITARCARSAANWLLAVFLLAFTYCGQPSSTPNGPASPAAPATTTQPIPSRGGSAKGAVAGDAPFTRHPDRLVLTKHARCRMGCRHITEKEIHEILENGEVNPEKSDPDSHPDPKYAVEGKTVEGQHLRIVFAVPKTANYLVVVTCIELGVEWQCDCR